MKESNTLETKQRKTNSGNEGSTDEADDEFFGEQAAELITFFQECALPRDTTKIKRAFEETIEIRQTMMLTLDKYKPLLDLLFLSPDLVSLIVLSKQRTDYLPIFLFNNVSQILFDFHLRFPAVNSKALSLVWPTIKRNIKILVDTPIDDADLQLYKKFRDIRCLINLLKLLSTHQAGFKTSLKALLTIYLVIHI